MVETSWRPVSRAGERFAEAVIQRPQETLLVLDFDGTLAAIVPNPADARLHETSAAALGQLLPKLAKVAILTGRGVETVRDLARLDERPELADLVVIGQYGAERYEPATGQVRRPEPPASIEAATQELQTVLTELRTAGIEVEGCYLENKGLAVAVHTRRTSDPEDLFVRLTGPATQIAARHGLQLEPGRLVLELRSHQGDKGQALRELVAEFSPAVVAMVGDDLGDLPAFKLLPQLRAEGLECCAVVSYSTEQPALAELADIRCEGPAGVAAWLTQLAACLSRHKS